MAGLEFGAFEKIKKDAYFFLPNNFNASLTLSPAPTIFLSICPRAFLASVAI